MKTTRIAPLVAILLTGCPTLAGEDESRPNIVFILADDLGYGDVRCMNPDGKIATPHIDQLASEGILFTDAHTSSSVCTPSRYSLLTGRYNWRSRLQSSVLGGFSAPLIDRDRLTVPELLKRHGYATACIGKWHLGMKMPERSDLSQPIEEGPTTRGFDEYFGISASLDMPPYAFIRNDRFASPVDTEKELWPGRPGPAASDFRPIDVLPALTREAVKYVDEKARGDRPFFLYLALTAPHTPIVPTAEWKGKSGLGDYADFVMQTDWTIGQVIAAVDRAGARDNTLIIVTSDNGCSPAADVGALEKLGHFPSGKFRGYKADIWEGGHRVPFVARWPGKIKPGSSNRTPIYLGGFMATCADILGAKLPENAGEDSVSILPALTGREDGALHDALVHHSIDGRFAIRQGDWKLELCPGSGGWGKPRDAAARKQGLPEVQLYNLGQDIGEQKNLQAEHAELIARLRRLLEQMIESGRSTPGAKQRNDAEIKVTPGVEEGP